MPVIEHPYEATTGNGRWYRGNLHTHSTQSDGTRELQTVIDEYRAMSHDFLMISDHDIYTGPREYAELDTDGLTLIPGNEISANGIHMLHFNASQRVHPHRDRQAVIDEVNASGGAIILNHPNWKKDFNHCPLDLMEILDGYLGLEVYNGVIGRLAGSPYATDKWDRILATGRRAWGFANDDSHADGDAGLGWNTVWSAENTPEAICAAITNGSFYASTGVVIQTIEVRDSRIHLRTENAKRIVAVIDSGRRIAVADSAEIALDAPDGATYIRFECWGDGESFAWTQPFFIRA
jgi:hypothetical protein